MPNFTSKLGAVDLSPYVRVGPDEGLDPYDASGFVDPAFSAAPFAEGEPFVSADVKNREVAIPLFLNSPAVAAAAGYQAAFLALAPSLYWRHGETVGTTANDSSGNGRTGTYGAGVTINQAGLLTGDADKAIALSGAANGSVTSGYNPFTGNLTVCGWMNMTSLAAVHNVFGGSAAGTEPLLQIQTNGDVNWWSDLGAASVTWGAGTFTAPGVIFWALTWNNATKTAELFINGVSKGTKVLANAFNATPGNFQLAATPAASGFLGTMDETAVFAGTILSAAQLLSLYNTGTGVVATTTQKDNLHTLIRSINAEIQRPTSKPLRLEWKDSGASNSTFYDVSYARFDPDFSFRRSEKGWFAGVLHVWCTPPYGHTATSRTLATVNSGVQGYVAGASLIGVASPVIGDQPALIQAQVSIASAGANARTSNDGLFVGFAEVDAGSYTYFFGPGPMGSAMTSAVNATLIGASGAIGSQALYGGKVVLPPYTNTPSQMFTFNLSPASAYAGDNRILMYVRTGITPGYGLRAFDAQRNALGPTAIATAMDWSLVDLGVIRVPTQLNGATQWTFTVEGAPVNGGSLYAEPPFSFSNVGGQASNAFFGAQAWIHYAGMLVVPENRLTMLKDTDRYLLGYDDFVYGGSYSAASLGQLNGLYDETGNQWGQASSVGLGWQFANDRNLYGASVAVLTYLNYGNRLITPLSYTNLRMTAWAQPKLTAVSIPSYSLFVRKEIVGGSQFLDGAFDNNNASIGMIRLVAGPGASNVAVATFAKNTLAQPFRLSLEVAGATAIVSYIDPAGARATVAFGPIAPYDQLGYPVIAGAGTTVLSSVSQQSVFQVQGFQVTGLNGRPAPPNGAFYNISVEQNDPPWRGASITGGQIMDRQLIRYGPPPSAHASTAAFVAFIAPVGEGTLGDPLAVAVAVRERFMIAR